MQGRKIFISYKYADDSVAMLPGLFDASCHTKTVRGYVNLLEIYFRKCTNHICKFEKDGEDLSGLSDLTIRDKLFDRIYDSTLTIVLISPQMRVTYLPENMQWIPREVSYSLREQTRENSNGARINCGRNAILGVVLPDRLHKYSYFCGNMKNFLFPILWENSHNIRNWEAGFFDSICHFDVKPGYITYVNWDEFNDDPEKYIAIAYEKRKHVNDYDIHVQLKDDF